jgi:hypothetical protein
MGEALNQDVKDAVGHSNVSLDVHEFVRPSVIEFTASTAGSNPLTPGAPDVDTKIKARFDFTKQGSLIASGRVFGDDYPNLEVFVAAPNGRTALLIDGRTTGGQDTGVLTRLWGSHDDQLLGQFHVSLPLGDRGGFQSDFRAGATNM